MRNNAQKKPRPAQATPSLGVSPTAMKPAPLPSRRKQVERSATAQAKLIGAAIALICEKGFSRTTTAEIAAAAGMTRGAIQHHFASRVDLVTTILHDVERRVLESFTAAAPQPNVPIEQRIDKLIDGLAAVSQSPVYIAAMDIWFTSRSDPDLREIVLHSVGRYAEHFRSLWQTSFGDEVPEQTISDCRRVVVAVSRGLVFSRMVSADPERSSHSVGLTLATTKTLIRNLMLAARDAKK